jgi:actin-related protein
MIKCDIGGNYLTEEVAKCVENKKITVVPRYGFVKKLVNGQPIVDYQKYDLTDPSYDRYCRYEILRDIKEALLTLATETAMETTESKNSSYDLPDGVKVDLEAERKKIPELMFNTVPEVPNFSGVQRMIVDAIVRSDLDIRKELYNNIVVSGGNTLIPGFVERVQKLVPEIAPPNVKVKMIAHMPSERKFSAWIGGSILSSLGSFQQMWMSKQEFDDHGAILVERKCA